MNFRNLNGIRDIQVMLKEAALYTGNIDGLFGKNSLAAIAKLTDSYCMQKTGSSCSTFPATVLPGDKNVQSLVSIQDFLKAAGLYSPKVDGVFGKGTRDGMRVAVDSFVTRYSLPTYGEAWSKVVSTEFLEILRKGCQDRGWPPEAANWLMACMYFESGGTFSPKKQNMAGARYFGLIQFGEDAAKDLNTTIASLVSLTAEQQLLWVFKYFDMWAKRGKPLKQLEDAYLTIFYPAAVGKSADTVIFRQDIDKVGYRQNNGFDTDKDGNITVGEINTRLYNAYYEGMDTVNRIIH